jgi:hypothetical protein
MIERAKRQDAHCRLSTDQCAGHSIHRAVTPAGHHHSAALFDGAARQGTDVAAIPGH